MTINDQEHVEIGRRLLCLPGVRIEFDGAANRAADTPGLSRGDTNFVSVGVDSPEAEVFTHYLCGSLSAEDESDLSYYNACSWGEETLTLADQRDLVLDRFGPLKTLNLQIESVFQIPEQVTQTLAYQVTLRHMGRKILTSPYTMGDGCVPGYWPKRPDDPQVYEMVMRTGEGGWGVDAQGRRLYVPGPPIMPDPERVLCSLISDAADLEFDSIEAWGSAFDIDPTEPWAQAAFRQCRKTGRAMRAALGSEWMRALTLWECKQ